MSKDGKTGAKTTTDRIKVQTQVNGSTDSVLRLFCPLSEAETMLMPSLLKEWMPPNEDRGKRPLVEGL